jgi:hypothetical protein
MNWRNFKSHNYRENAKYLLSGRSYSRSLLRIGFSPERQVRKIKEFYIKTK